MRRKRICLFAPYPSNESPSQRFRFEQYLPLLRENGFEITFLPFINQSSTKFRSRTGLSKIAHIIKAVFFRLLQLRNVVSADFVFVHREVASVGPPILEWLIARVMKKKMIYDFDDAIWTTDKINESAVSRLIRWRSKVASICRWSHKVSCGNVYLADYARNVNKNVVINPTTVDTKSVHSNNSVRKSSDRITIGWTGSRSTLKYLHTVLEPLQALEKKHPNIRVLIIADEKPDLPLKNLEFRPWKKETELTDLQEIDIGIMPLPDDEWTRGKCGFKALQYMAISVPAVVSPVGVNNEIINHGVNGYCCSTSQEWFTTLEYLILNPDKRREIGKNGRQKVTSSYSVSANAANFLSLFQ